MEVKALMKEWRIWVLLLSLTASLLLLSPEPGNPASFYAQDDNGEWQMQTGINKGLDLEGGTRILLSVDDENNTQEQTEQIADVLERRVSAFGLTQASVRTVRLGEEFMIQMEVASTNQTQLRELVSSEGQFEARMPIHVDGERNYTIDNTYTFVKDGEGVTVNGQRYLPGDEFELDGAKFYYVNDTGSRANLEVVAYSGEDINNVLTNEGSVNPRGDTHQFRFPVVITPEAADNVMKVSQNYEVRGLPGQEQSQYLTMENGETAQLMLYVDGDMQSALNVAGEFRRSPIQQPFITGGAETAAEARENMKELQAILQSGRLPAPIQIESISTVSSSLGGQFMTAAIFSIISALIAVGGLIYVRYGDIRLTAPIVLTGSSEVFILLGAFFSTIITLDLASIAGIIAAVGTGVDDQIVITDEAGKEKIRSWKKRLKRAFFVIFTAAASTIGAMMPLISPSSSNLAIGAAGLGLMAYSLYSRRTKPHHFAIGAFAVMVSAVAFQFNPSGFALQAVRGFAVTTILGILVGIMITRPAYAKILENMDYEGEKN